MQYPTQDFMDRNENSPVSIHLKKETQLKLLDLSASLGRIQNDLIEEAVENYCDCQAWQFLEIQEGIRDAEAGYLFSTEEVIAQLELKRADRMQTD